METPIDPQTLKVGEKYKIVVYKPMPTPKKPYTTVSTTPLVTYDDMEFVEKDIVRMSQAKSTGPTTSSKPLGLGRAQNRARNRARESARDRSRQNAQGTQVPVLIFKGQDGSEVKIENSKENKIYSINSNNDTKNGNAVIQPNTVPLQSAGKKKRKTRRKKTKSKKSKKNKSKKNKIKTKKRSKKLK